MDRKRENNLRKTSEIADPNLDRFVKECRKTLYTYSYIGKRQMYHSVFINRNLNYVIQRKKPTAKKTESKKIQNGPASNHLEREQRL